MKVSVLTSQCLLHVQYPGCTNRQLGQFNGSHNHSVRKASVQRASGMTESDWNAIRSLPISFTHPCLDFFLSEETVTSHFQAHVFRCAPGKGMRLISLPLMAQLLGKGWAWSSLHQLFIPVCHSDQGDRVCKTL